MRAVVQVLAALLVLAGAFGIARWLILSKPEIEPQPTEAVVPRVRVLTVEPAAFQRTVHARGEVVARDETVLVSEVAARVAKVSPDLITGGSFDEGDVLVELDDADYALALTRAKAVVQQAQTALDREVAESEVARAEFEQLGEGEPTALALRQPQLAEATARLRAAEAELEKAELDLERTKILAPYPGRVRSEDVGVGQFVVRGQALAVIFATDVAEVRLSVPDRELRHLDIPLNGSFDNGPSVLLHTEFAGEERQWSGQVKRLGAVLDRKSRMVTLVVEVRDPYGQRVNGDAQAPLLPGLFVDAVIEGRRDDSAIRLPRRALLGDDRVLVVDKESRLTFRDVDVLWRQGDELTVGAGLEPGERVTVTPLAAPVEGMRVKVLGSDVHGEDEGVAGQ